MDATETDDEALIGDACHIVGDSGEGPRGESELTDEERDKYGNLILLCKVHHKLVDDQPNAYTVEYLQQLKEGHEEWVRESLQGFDQAKQRDHERYAALIEEWSRRADLNSWSIWTSWLLSNGQPSLHVDVDASIRELREWLFTRIWPRRYPALESAFENFRAVLSDFQETFVKYAERNGEELWTRKFYQIDEWNPERYHRLAAKFDFHVDLVQDLTLELTRAANYVCDRVRQYLDPSFRMYEGALVVDSGPVSDLSSRKYRPEYRGEERTDRPYPGLDHFLKVRFERDIRFGQPSYE